MMWMKMFLNKISNKFKVNKQTNNIYWIKRNYV